MHISFLKKKKWQLICGNGIVEIEGKKNCGSEFVAMALQKFEGKKIVAISLWQWHCQNRRKKKKKRISEIDLGVILIGVFIGNDQ